MKRMHLIFAVFLLLLSLIALSGCVEKLPDETAGADLERRTKFRITSPMDMGLQTSARIRFDANPRKCDSCQEQTNVRLSQKWNADLILCGGTGLCEMGNE